MTAEELKQAVEQQFGVKASLLYVAPVRHIFGDTIWEGPVHVFDLEGYPTAKHAYAWPAGGGIARAVVVPHGNGILGPAHAVRAQLIKTGKAPGL